jgi:hypothetical protein
MESNASFKHFEMAYNYIKKENPESVKIVINEKGFSVSFKFLDLEQRECEVILHEKGLGTEPDLIKKMKLKTRKV